MAQIFFDQDADLAVLEGKTVAILGYGNQGRAQAQNLRDSGVRVMIGNRDDEYAPQVAEDGFTLHSIKEAAAQSDVLLLLMPDEIIPAVYRAEIEPGMRPGKALVYASGYNVYYGLLESPPGVDVVMVAPSMIGTGVRATYLNGTGFPSLIGVAQDATGNALATALAVAKAIGSTKMGAIMSSFAEETLVDLMYEHLGIIYSIRRACEILVEAGVSPEAAISEFYASGEGAELEKAYGEIGLFHQLPLHSRTSQYGQEVTSLLSPEEEAAERRRLRRIVENIRSGQFARDWTAEQQAGYPTWNRVRQENLNHPIIQAERELYRRLGRIPPDVL